MLSRKTLKSCQSCRSAKAKCVQSPDPGTKSCQRCIKYNKECFYADSRPRPKRGKQAHTRVAEVEKKLDNICTLLESERRVKPNLEKVSINGEKPSHPEAIIPAIFHEAPNVTKRDHSLPLATIKTEPTHGHRHRDRDAIDKEILSEKEASDLLLFYRAAKHDFPFICVKPDSSLDMLRYEKPFTLLSILTISSQRTRPLQILLEKELREVLASKVIIEGELSHDVLQGIMVYLSWYHYNFRPCRQQIYLLTQLCGSMAIDLGLHKPPDAKPGFLIHPSKTCMATKSNTVQQVSDRRESMRLYVGVYCLTTSLSIMLRKPNGMSWSPYLERCCKELSEDPEMPSDPYLLFYVQLLHVCEDISSTFGYCSPEQDVPSNYSRVQSTVRAFIANIEEISERFPPEIQTRPSLISLYHTAQTLAYEIILHLDVQSSSSSTTINSWLASPIRTSILLSCLDSLGSSLDWFSTLPLTDFERLNLLDMSRITYHLLILGRLTIAGTPGSDGDMVAQTLQINAYYDAFLEKYQQLALLHGTDETKSIHWGFHQSFLASRNWISTRIAERMNGKTVADVVDVPVEKDGVQGMRRGNGNHHHEGRAQLGRAPHPFDVADSWDAVMAALPIAGMEGSTFL